MDAQPVEPVCGTLVAMSDSDRPLDIADPATWPYWMKIEEVAAVLRVSEAHVTRLINNGQIPATSVTTGTQRATRRIRRDHVLELAPGTLGDAEGTPGEE